MPTICARNASFATCQILWRKLFRYGALEQGKGFNQEAIEALVRGCWRCGRIGSVRNGEPNMDMGDPRKIDSYIRSAVRILFSVGLAVLVILTGCSQDSSSRIHVELRDTPEAKPTAQTIPKADPSCPAGDLPDTDVQTVPSKSHSVKLSWNLSTSSNDLNGQNIRYCLYRAEGGPVQKNNTPSTYPCARCGRVTKIPVQGKTTDPDWNVENGVHYCYVAVAIDTTNGKLSGFSNQADAVIPPSRESPFCNTQTSTKKRRGRR